MAKSFIRWLADQNYIDEDFRHLYKSPKQAFRIPSFLSVDEALTVMKTVKKEKSKHKNRDTALFLLLYGGGLRVSEACQLKVRDIDFAGQTLKIKGKGGKERLVSLPRQAMEHLKAFKGNDVFLFGPKTSPCPKKPTALFRILAKKQVWPSLFILTP